MIQRLAFLGLQASLHAGHMMTCSLANRGVHQTCCREHFRTDRHCSMLVRRELVERSRPSYDFRLS